MTTQVPNSSAAPVDVDLTVSDDQAAAPAEIQISVVLPVHNEEECLEAELTRIRVGLDASPYTWELIAVDDGSSDRSPEILDAHPWVRRITLPTNRGSGTARRLGTEAALGTFVVWTDADMTYPNGEIAALVDGLGTADQIVGARTTEQGTLKVLRTPAKWFVRRLAQRLTDTEIKDLNSGFRAFRREAATPYLPLLPTGFSCVTTLTMAMLSDAREIRYTPISYAARVGRSKFHPIRDTYRYLLQVVRMVTFFNPIRVFFPLALILLLIGGGKLVYDIVTDPFKVAITTVVVLMTGLQVLILGLLADLIVTRTRSRAAP